MVQEELKQLFEIIMNRTDEIENLNLFIKMKNGNKIKYSINRKKEMALAQKEEKRIAKLKKIEEIRQLKAQKKEAENK